MEKTNDGRKKDGRWNEDDSHEYAEEPPPIPLKKDKDIGDDLPTPPLFVRRRTRKKFNRFARGAVRDPGNW